LVTMNECPSCGRDLAKDMLFCPYCGSKVQAASLSPEALGPEQVKGVIPMAESKESDEAGKMYTLVITDSRIIIARTTKEDMDKVRKASGSVLLGGSILEPERHRQALGAYSRRYRSMEPESIFSESEGNSTLRIADIISIRISSEEDAKGNLFYLLAFETRIGPKRLRIPNDKDSRDLLISTFGEKVRW
jgi:hypothetical protein